MAMEQQKFSEKEVGQILAKAAALQSGTSGPANSTGTTLEELQKIAEEIGIHPEAVIRASNEIGRARQTTVGASSRSVLLEQSIGGHLSEENWERIVTASRTAAGSAGSTQLTGDIREWTGATDSESLLVGATNRQGRTHLKLLGDNRGAVAGTVMISIILGMFFTMGALVLNIKLHTGAELTTASIFLAVMLVVLSSKASVRRVRRTHQANLNSLMDRIVEISESGTTTVEDPISWQLQNSSDAMAEAKKSEEARLQLP